jgi:hypothetical protein
MLSCEAINIFYAATAAARAESNQPPMRRIFACVLANNPKNTSRTALSEGREALVLMRRRNSSYNRSMAFVVGNDLCWLAGKPQNLSSSSAASSRLAATEKPSFRHFASELCRAPYAAARFAA